MIEADGTCFSTGSEEIFVEITDLIFTKLLQVHDLQRFAHISGALQKSFDGNT
jgi:hypothetical protein